MERLDSTGDNACTVCHDTMRIFAVGHCDHPVCYKCSTRMRVLCEQLDCPICRSTMPQVAFVYDNIPFKDIDLRRCIPNRKNKIFYETEEIEDMYLDLLEFRCRHCPKRKPERTFSQLQTHMRRDHQLFACDICLEHLKIFPYETKFYDRKSLAVHRRVGDKDDKSYKGHPLCEFCDARYLDKDELMKHLRKDHFFCHFCDQQGSNAYYNDYPDLVVHFEESHFLCTEDECGSPNTRFTHAFASEIDLKSHKATVHNMKSKEMRTIQVDFQFAPRHHGHNRGNGLSSDDYEDSGTYRQRNRSDRYGNRRRHHDDPNLQRALEQSLQEKTRPPVQERVPDPIQDFPTLNGLPVPQVQQKTAPKTQREAFPTLGASNIKAQKPTTPEDDFPTLGNKTPKAMTGSSSRVDDFSSVGSSKARAPKPAASVTKREEDFPGLSASKSKVQNPKINSARDFPTLGASSSVGSKSADNKNYAAVTHLMSETPRPVVKKEKPRESQPVSLGTVKSAAKERWASQAFTDDDYPSLSNKSKSASRAKSAAGAGDNSSSSWLQKSTVTEVPKSSAAAPTVSLITEKPKENIEVQPKKQTPKVRPFTADNDFPSLGGGASRQTSVPGNITWTMPKSDSNNKKTAHSKIEKKYSEPPGGNKSDKPPPERPKETKKPVGEISSSDGSSKKSIKISKKEFPSLPKGDSAAGEISSSDGSSKKSIKISKKEFPSLPKGDSAAGEISSSDGSSKKSIKISKKEFPSLPKGDSAAKQSNIKKQSKTNEAKKLDPKPVDTDGNKSKKNKKGPIEKSLNDIASGLMNTSISNSKSNNKKKKSNGVDENGNKPKENKNVSNTKPSKPDLSDNTPVSNDRSGPKEKLSGTKEKLSSESSPTIDCNNSFPSLHAMSSSVQSTTAPPGFSPTSLQLQQPRQISAPPGFSKPAPPGLSKPTFSVYDYIQPADFTNRNQALVQNIRFCLEMVEDGFDKFKAFSFQFRQGNISASAYYTNCQLLIGDHDFKDIFPELLALLPDINKQQELWFEHQVVASGRSSSKGQHAATTSWNNLSPCSKCGQIVLSEDLQYHSLQHGGDVEDFPSLRDVGSMGNGSGASLDRNANNLLKGAWIKATT